MSLFDFIRLLYRNAVLIIVVPVSLAVLVFLFTRNQDKEYASNALIYTGIASGFNIESGTDQKLDYRAVNNAFDNLLLVIQSRITLEEVSLRLLASHMILEGPKYGVIQSKSFVEINMYITEDLRSKAQDSTVESTYKRLNVLYEMGNPLLQELINQGSSHYSLKTLRQISAKRHKSSDMVEISFKSTDPGICQQTLAILLEVFTRRYKELKQSETGDVVAYFEQELQKGKNNLNNAEDRLTQFRVDSRVINYVEQTKAIAFKKQNALEEFAMKKMNLKATEAALTQIENKLKIRESILGKNVEILDKKKRLTEITGQLALLQAQSGQDSVFNELIKEQTELKESLKRDVEVLFTYSNSKEGLPSRQLLNDWLNNVVQMERDRVTVELYQQRLNDLDNEYDRFAPMGSTIARLEREINVYEREYLEILHGLNMAKLRQQNIEMSSNVEILDQPKLPQEPLPSKRALMIVASFMFGFMTVVSSLVAGVLLDNSLKNPIKAQKITDLNVIGAFPKMDERLNKKYNGITHQLAQILSNKLKLEAHSLNLSQPICIATISTQAREGKSTILKQLFDNMSESGESVCIIHPKNNITEEADHHFPYDTENHSDYSLARILASDLNQYKYVLIELPAWVEGNLDVTVLNQVNLMLWTVRADRSWTAAYQSMLTDISKISTTKPHLIINGVKPYYLDQIMAEVPVKRSSLMKWIRKMVRFELGNSGLKTSKS